MLKDLTSHPDNRAEDGCYFFTGNLLEHYQNQLLVQNIDLLSDIDIQVDRSG